MFKADLHMHSCFSDGHWSASQLVAHAKALKINGLSITDHDSTAAYPEILTPESQQNLKIIPGIELSSHFNDTTVHVLGYSYTLDHPVLNAAIDELTQARQLRIHSILERLQRRNITISYDELTAKFKQGQLGRPHIASLIVQKGFASNIANAFDNYLSDNHMGSLKLKTLDAQQAIDIIQQSQGVAVLAHPHLIKHKNKLRSILTLPFDGIEAYYARFPNKTDYFLEIAQQNNWLVTGGSDFHFPKTYQPLGCSYTPEDVFHQLYAKACENNPNYYQHPKTVDETITT